MVSKDDIDRAFDSSESLIEEAADGLEAFRRMISDFTARNQPAIISDPDVKTGNKLIKVRFPDSDRVTRRKAYRVVCDVRHALDQAIHAATVCFDGKTHGSKTYFPFAENPNDFEAQFFNKKIGRTKDATPRIAGTIRQFEPWWTSPIHVGGNDLLRFLGKISGPNKHQVGLTAIPYIDGNWINSSVMTDVVAFGIPPERVRGTNDFILVTLRGTGSIKYNGGITCIIGLSETHPQVPREAVSALSEMFNIARNLVLAIKDVCVSELT